MRTLEEQEEFISTRPTLWGSSLEWLLDEIARGDLSGLETIRREVDEAEATGGYVYSPGEDRRFLREIEEFAKFCAG